MTPNRPSPILSDNYLTRIENRDRLNDHVVGAIDVELDLGTRVRVAETKLRALEVALLQLLEQLVGVQADPAHQLQHHLVCLALISELGLDCASEVAFGDSELNLGLLTGLGKIHLEEGFEVLVDDTWGFSWES
ncbi:hypothetical protein BC936DRAFT_141338 [Jimgerdemannia flammicorona]|uniref:Uncharacterized protein n=2 Tax=Jimgerdemannia flammicorona TaxID=994334 RepID=A0A433DG56_9FUNG|nr:hypothetical protein BC936DRAFT_141338 [Jimgerdemannia flammicorona]RUS31653.1 hypothetical protein BC938DRAFT_477366 [Jimgerdemannia flammicorona]